MAAQEMKGKEREGPCLNPLRAERKKTTFAGALIFLVFLIGCGPMRQLGSWTLSIAPAWFGVTEGEWGQIEDWLTCEDCSDGQLRRVMAIGPRAGHVLTSTLQGLPEDRKEVFRNRISEVWRASGSPGPGFQAYEDHYLANLQAKTQRRSAEGLAYLGLAEPLRIALDSARAWNYRDDVVATIQRLLSTAPQIQRYVDGRVSGVVLSAFVPGYVWIREEDDSDQGGPSASRPVAHPPADVPRSMPTQVRPLPTQVRPLPTQVRPLPTQVRPLGGVPIHLRRCTRAPGVRQSPSQGRCTVYDPLPARIDSTEKDGSFSFDSLPEGVYEISPDTAGGRFQPVMAGPLLAFLYGRADSTRVLIVLRPNRTRFKESAGARTLPRAPGEILSLFPLH